MVSKKVLALMLGVIIVFSLMMLGMTISRTSLDTNSGQALDEQVTVQGKVNFYVLEKLEPQTVTGKVTFDVIKKN